LLPTLLTAFAIAIFVVAGNWQRSRMHQKLALSEQLAAAATAPVVSLPAGDSDWMAWRFRIVETAGQYDANRQILIDNRIHAGRAGYHVVAPLVLEDGRAVLVNRGFVPVGPTRDALPSAPPPSGMVRIRGRINPAPGRYLELGPAVAQHGVWQNLDPARFAAATGLPVLPIVIEQVDGPADGLVRDWSRPDAGADKHRIYMMQWYAFAACAAALWIGFTFRRRRRLA
jgi:surfeit locus 1 family protein